MPDQAARRCSVAHGGSELLRQTLLSLDLEAVKHLLKADVCFSLFICDSAHSIRPSMCWSWYAPPQPVHPNPICCFVGWPNCCLQLQCSAPRPGLCPEATLQLTPATTQLQPSMNACTTCSTLYFCRCVCAASHALQGAQQASQITIKLSSPLSPKCGSTSLLIKHVLPQMNHCLETA